MYRKNFIVSLFVIAVFLTGSLVAFAQTAPVRGRVQIRKADNTIVPVEGAEITAYRTDVSKGKLPSAKTDKKGSFSFAGVPIGQTYVLVATAPNIRAGYFPNVQANMDSIVIEVEEGDGKAPTEEEIRAALASVSTTGELTPEEKKKREEIAKRNAEIEAKNRKIQNANEIVNRAISEGKKAYDASDWDTAIAKFDEGYNADPDFPGTAPVFLNNKADALKQRGVISYKKSTTDAANKAAHMEAMKKDLLESINAAQRAVEVLKTATSTDANAQKGYAANRMLAYSIMIEDYRFLIETRADETKATEAAQVVDAYAAIEPDAAKKAKAQIQMADALRKIGKSDEAIPLYRKALENAPDNPDLLAGLGLSLFNSGVIANNKEQMQEGLNIMERFTSSAPDTHALKASVKEAVDYLKTQEKLTPQKTTKPATTKKRT
ncbi:MAG TPA: tetratricopeptide repeat protein [Pyrinomonadaceae bacterium]